MVGSLNHLHFTAPFTRGVIFFVRHPVLYNPPISPNFLFSSKCWLNASAFKGSSSTMPYSLVACMHYIHIYLSTITVLHPFSSLQYPQVHLRPFLLSSTNHKMFNSIPCQPNILQGSLATAAFGSMTLPPQNPTTMRKEESQFTTHTMLIVLSLDPKLHGIPQTYSRRYSS